MKKFLNLFLVVAIIFSFVNFAHAEKYRLEKVLIFSRHNVRAPLIAKNSPQYNSTSQKWIEWTTKPGELTSRGGILETEMGQYFRKYLENENFIPENYIPAENEFKFYANSFQRTIATAQYFSSGMLPVANVKVEHKYSVGSWDENFNMNFGNFDENFRQKVFNEIFTLHNAKNFQDMAENLSPSLNQLESILDFKNSPYAKEKNIQHFPTDDLKVTIEKNKSVSWQGGVQLAASICDTLIMQNYEDPSTNNFIFGKKITPEQWDGVKNIHDFAIETVCGTPSIAVSFAKPMLKFLRQENSVDGRKFTFVCGHDTNVMSMLTALGVERFSLPNTIERKIPIGVKFVVEKRIGTDGKEYAKVYLAYQNSEQIKNLEILSLENPPQIFYLKFKGLTANEDGLYLYSDFEKRWNDTIEKAEKMSE
ncbi:MAG: histidine-type phosphatase [Selenomonadaceae bacterium]|nr:histidine-type phosphatase [Selenomonadaceae bacterium]